MQGAFLHPARSAAERRCTRRKAPLHPTQYSGSSYVRPVFPVSLPLNVHGTCIHVAPSTLVVNNFPQLRAESQFAEVKVKMDRRNEGREVTHSAGQCMNPWKFLAGISSLDMAAAAAAALERLSCRNRYSVRQHRMSAVPGTCASLSPFWVVVWWTALSLQDPPHIMYRTYFRTTRSPRQS